MRIYSLVFILNNSYSSTNKWPDNYQESVENGVLMPSRLPYFPFLVYFFLHTRQENGTGSGRVVSDVGVREVTMFHGIPPLNCPALHGPCRKPGTVLKILSITSLLSEAPVKSFTCVLPPDSCPLKECRGELKRRFAYLRRMSGFWNWDYLFWLSGTPKM